MIPISDLEIYARVVETGNMSAAGREMGLSPAVVSKRISQLEKRLGTRLIQRTTRQLTLTETGEGFYQRIVGIIAGIEEAESFVTRRNTMPEGTLKVSAPTSFGRQHIARYLGEFLERYPDLKFQLDLSDRFVDIVGEGFDVAIRIGELDDSMLVAKKLAPNRRVICAAPSYIKRLGEPKTIEDLEKHNCLGAAEQEVWRLQGPEGSVSLRARGNLKTNSTEVVREAALAGVGIALRSTWDVADDLVAGRLKVILPEYHESSRVAVYAVYPSREYLPAKVSVFLDFLHEKFGPKPYWDKELEGALVD